VNCKIVRETPKAWLIDDGKRQEWFPKSQGEIYDRSDGTNDLCAEEWILKSKGFI
jgi:hypothetical protein